MKKQKTTGYGLLSMMAMTIGIVIGSGIFVKNSGLVGTNGSILLTLISWVIGSLIVITLVIAFFEIISITEITGEQSTMTNWGKHLFGIRFGKFIGYYFSFAYFPIIMASLFLFSGDQFAQTIEAARGISFIPGPDGSGSVSFHTHMVVTIGFGAMFALIILLLNSITSRPGKYFQNFGTVLKIIPLSFMVILFVVMLIMGNIHFPSKSEIGGDKTSNPVLLIFMTLPSILFAFDGFILAGSLSKEANSKTTFKISFVASILFIVVIYILFSLSVFGLGSTDDPSHGAYGTITNSIYAVFSLGAARVIAPIVSAIIIISILNGVSGVSMASTRFMSDLSLNNCIKDKDGELIIKNNAGVSTMSGMLMFLTTVTWFVILVIFDSYVGSKTGHPLVIVGFMSNLMVISAFILYSVVIIGGIINRFTNKVEVEKNKLFLPAAIFSVILVLIITSYFAFTIFFPSKDLIDSNKYAHWSEITILIIFIIYLTSIVIYNMFQTEKMTKEVIEEKSKKIENHI